MTTAAYELASSTRTKVVLRRARAPFIHLDYRKAYSKANAFNLAILATLAYQEEEAIRDYLFGNGDGTDRVAAFLESPNAKSAFLTGADGEVGWRIQDFQYLEDERTDTQVFLFRTEAYQLIACRGTESLTDGLSDANAHRVPYREGVGKIHEGFYKAFLSIRDKLDLALPGSKGLPVICCGHSLGGALATLVATYVRRKHKREVLLYTFGCPIVGDADFARHFTETEPITAWRCVHNRDLVTMVPPANANLRVHLLPLALANPLYLLPATVDPFGKPYTHLGKLVFLRRLDGGSFSVDVDRKTPAYLRVPDGVVVKEERPKWEQVLNWAKVSVKDHFMEGYVSILGSDLKQAVQAWLASAEASTGNVRKVIGYLEAEIAALERAKAKAEKDALMPLAGAPADASASTGTNPGRLTPSERLKLAEDALRDKLMERTLHKARLTALASPAYRSAVLKDILDRPMSPSLRKEFEYQDKNLKY